ncbi:MAG: stage V sporulation protein AC [Acutalibacteraceae bacterium]
MSISENEYSKMADKASPPSPWLKNCFFAFLIGGAICTLGELVFQLMRRAGFDEDASRTVVSISLILLTAILTGFGVFDKIAQFAGAGTMVPITGFANSIVAPAMEYHSEGFVLGTAANMFKLAGPVIVFGCSASVIYGIIAFIFKLY